MSDAVVPVEELDEPAGLEKPLLNRFFVVDPHPAFGLDDPPGIGERLRLGVAVCSLAIADEPVRPVEQTNHRDFVTQPQLWPGRLVVRGVFSEPPFDELIVVFFGPRTRVRLSERVVGEHRR